MGWFSKTPHAAPDVALAQHDKPLSTPSSAPPDLTATTSAASQPLPPTAPPLDTSAPTLAHAQSAPVEPTTTTPTVVLPPADDADYVDNPRNSFNIARPSFGIPYRSRPTFPKEPPPLNYSLDDNNRKFTIVWFWSLIVVDVIAIPIILYFVLSRFTTFSTEIIFSISTGCLGGVSIIEYFLRFYRLFKKGSTCRPLNGARRWHLDWFHWNFSIAWFPVMLELIVGTSIKDTPIRLLAMPVSTICWWFGFELLLSDILRLCKVKQFCRISSLPVGSDFRPAIYALIEDVVAVDGSGGTEFRRNFDRRYRESHYFRQMLHRLTLFWGFGANAAATLTTILVFTLPVEAAYCVGWVLPFVWAAVSAALTTFYVKRCLRHERAMWGVEEHA